MAETTTQKEKYINDFRILSDSSVGVILTRTREPHRCQEVLMNIAFEAKQTFKVWNVAVGWTSYTVTKDGVKKSSPDGQIDIYAASEFIGDLMNGGANAWLDTYCVIHYPHWALKSNPSLIQLLKEYAQIFTQTSQRVILLCPEETQLPPELENDVFLLDFELPGRAELREVYEEFMDNLKDDDDNPLRPPMSALDVDALISSGTGMTIFEYETALSRATITHSHKLPNVSMGEINQMLMETKTEVIKRSSVLELVKAIPMELVGGLELAKEWLDDHADNFGEEARDFGVDVPKGIALIGPPGTGKSILSQAIAARLRKPLIRLDVGKAFGSYVGESEKNIRIALKHIEAMAPCVAWVDEVEKMFPDPRAGSGDGGIGKRVLGTILNFMQESIAGVFWVFTANRAENLPPELVRKGRLDELFAVLPPNRAERLEVLKIHLKKRKQDVAKIKDLDIAVARSKGFVSAEIESAVKEAVVKSFRHKVPVTGQLIADQLAEMRPLSESFPQDFAKMVKWADQNARRASLPDPEEDEPVEAEATSNGVRIRRKVNLNSKK